MVHQSDSREKGVRKHLCEAPEGPVPGKWFLTAFSRAILSATVAPDNCLGRHDPLSAARQDTLGPGTSPGSGTDGARGNRRSARSSTRHVRRRPAADVSRESRLSHGHSDPQTDRQLSGRQRASALRRRSTNRLVPLPRPGSFLGHRPGGLEFVLYALSVRGPTLERRHCRPVPRAHGTAAVRRPE